MNKKVRTAGGITTTLTDKHYLAAGGEGSIYVNGGIAYKLYHDSDKKATPPQKIQELSRITNPNVIVPRDLIYDVTDGKTIGYTTNFVPDANPLIRFITKTFKVANNIDHKMIAELVKQMQLITVDIHNSKCLIVDYNELNVLVKIVASDLIPYYIDTDSYATPSYRATAVMDSIRDRRVTSYDKAGTMHYNPDVMSDWYSFGILAFWLYSNIHVFRGIHPNYKPNQKHKQMDDGVSVFHPGVRVPPLVNDFNIIPKRHLDWFKDIFRDNKRSIPPLPDSIAPIAVPTQIIIVNGTDKLAVTEIASYSSAVHSVIQHMGVNYVVTQTHGYSDKKEIIAWNKPQKVLLCPASDGTMISAILKGTTVSFSDMSSGVPFETIQSKDMFQRNGAIYTMAAGKLIENSFSRLGQKFIHRIKELENVSQLTATMYDGCVIQDLLGKKFLVLPYKKEMCFSRYIPQLDAYRVIDAKADKNVVVVIAEKSGKYSRFIIIFERKEYRSFEVREVVDVAYDEINFAVLENGLCMLLASPTELELFVEVNKYDTMTDPPFDANMPLFSTSSGFFFINNNSIHQVKRK